MFLYGMHVMAEGTQKSVGNKMKDFLGMLTSNRLKAVLVGTLITGIIQSSGATTVMVVGFVSAGLMTLSQAVGVIMGANIGTTVTAWIVSLSQIGDSMKMLNPEFYAPVLASARASSCSPSRRQKRAARRLSSVSDSCSRVSSSCRRRLRPTRMRLSLRRSLQPSARTRSSACLPVRLSRPSYRVPRSRSVFCRCSPATGSS